MQIVQFSKNEPELADVAKLLVYLQHTKKEGTKAFSEEDTKGMTEQSFMKEIMGTICKFKLPSQQKPGIEMGLYK